MIDNISLFNSGQAAASIQSANYKNEQSKASGFEQALNAAREAGEDEQIMEAAREFESYFIQMMLKEMRNTVPKDGLIPRGNAEEIFQSMLDEEYAKNAANGSGMGIAQMIYQQMTRSNQPPPAIEANPIKSGVADSLPDDGDIASEEV